MAMRPLLIASLVCAGIFSAAAPSPAAAQKVEKRAEKRPDVRKVEVKRFGIRRGVQVAPLPREKATRSHAPYESGQCGVCHVNNDAANVGPIRHASVNEQCFECHDDVRDVMARKHKHVPAAESCTDCHNAHNSSEPALLSHEMVELCVMCHADIKN